MSSARRLHFCDLEIGEHFSHRLGRIRYQKVSRSVASVEGPLDGRHVAGDLPNGFHVRFGPATAVDRLGESAAP